MNVFKPCSTTYNDDLYYGRGYYAIPTLEYHSKDLETDCQAFRETHSALCYINGIVVSTKGGHYVGQAPKFVTDPFPTITLENIKYILSSEPDSEKCVSKLKKLLSC